MKFVCSVWNQLNGPFGIDIWIFERALIFQFSYITIISDARNEIILLKSKSQRDWNHIKRGRIFQKRTAVHQDKSTKVNFKTNFDLHRFDAESPSAPSRKLLERTPPEDLDIPRIEPKDLSNIIALLSSRNSNVRVPNIFLLHWDDKITLNRTIHYIKQEIIIYH